MPGQKHPPPGAPWQAAPDDATVVFDSSEFQARPTAAMGTLDPLGAAAAAAPIHQDEHEPTMIVSGGLNSFEEQGRPTDRQPVVAAPVAPAHFAPPQFDPYAPIVEQSESTQILDQQGLDTWMEDATRDSAPRLAKGTKNNPQPEQAASQPAAAGTTSGVNELFALPPSQNMPTATALVADGQPQKGSNAAKIVVGSLVFLATVAAALYIAFPDKVQALRERIVPSTPPPIALASVAVAPAVEPAPVKRSKSDRAALALTAAKAAKALANGDLDAALALYRELSEKAPEDRVYRSFARTLERKVNKR